MLELIDRMSPASWATLGVALIAADLFLLNSFHVASVGLMAFGVAAIDALGAPVGVQAWSLVLGTPIIAAVGLRLLRHHDEEEEPQQNESLIGLRCRVASINPDDPARGVGHVDGHGEWPIYSTHGDLAPKSNHLVLAVVGNNLEIGPPAPTASRK